MSLHPRRRSSFAASALAVALSFALLACAGGDGPAIGTAPDVEEPELAAAAPVASEVALPSPTVDLPPERPPLPAGETDGDGVVVKLADVAGAFVYGMGANPGGLFAQLGATGAGIAPFRVIIELADQVATIRALDPDTERPVTGSEGVVARYPYTSLEGGRVRIDLSEALHHTVIGLYGDCRYESDSYELVAEPVFADGLWTWPANERYTRVDCGGWLPSEAGGTHVHYLRSVDAGRDYVARASDPDGPFGYFLAGTPAAPRLARLSGVADADGVDGDVVYYLHDDFPEAYVPAAEAVFEAWNDALEPAVGRRPFSVERAPADMIPWDPRYHVVWWDDSDGSGAIAPFAEDPATGEIFQAFVVMWFGDLERLVDQYSDFFETHPDVIDHFAPVRDPRDERAWWAEVQRPHLEVRPGWLRPRAFPRRGFDGSVVARAMSTYGADLGEQELAEAIVRDYLLHEVGHNLGLRHNFLASADRAHTTEADAASSTMDYVIGQPVPGSYDVDALQYGYGEGAYGRDFLYCSDEHTEVDPGCARWDFGHPVWHLVETLDRLAERYPVGTAFDDVEEGAQRRDLAGHLRRLRQFVNSDYEAWDVESPVDVLSLVLDRVEDPDVHPWLRAQLALYPLYTRHRVTAYWEPGAPDVWWDFPALDGAQAAALMARYEALILDPAPPNYVKRAIIEKLPTAAVVGAPALLDALSAHFEGLDAPSEDELVLRDAVRAALAE